MKHNDDASVKVQYAQLNAILHELHIRLEQLHWMEECNNKTRSRKTDYKIISNLTVNYSWWWAKNGIHYAYWLLHVLCIRKIHCRNIVQLHLVHKNSIKEMNRFRRISYSMIWFCRFIENRIFVLLTFEGWYKKACARESNFSVVTSCCSIYDHNTSFKRFLYSPGKWRILSVINVFLISSELHDPKYRIQWTPNSPCPKHRLVWWKCWNIRTRKFRINKVPCPHHGV